MKYNSIQYLRGIAAAAVVLNHASRSLYSGEQSWFPYGIGGVDLFFVISGFVIFYATAKDNQTVKQFYWRRILRIVPIYLLLTTAAYATGFLLPRHMLSASVTDYLRSILFVPYINTASHQMNPELVQGWTLNYEMYFYGVFGLLLLGKCRTRFYGCLGVFGTLILLGIAFRPSNVILATYTSSMLSEFLAGVVIAYLALRHPTKLAAVVAAASVLTIAALVLGGPRCFVYGSPAVAIVSGAVLLDKRIPAWSWLLLLGDASYSLYLTHTFVLAAMHRVFALAGDVTGTGTRALYMATATLLATVAGCAFYKIVEAPITNALSGKRVRMAAPQIVSHAAPAKL